MKSRMKDTLLLVGDASSDRAELHNIFETTYNLLEAENAAQGIMLVEQNSQCIVAVLADISPSDENGLRSLISACRSSLENEIPVVCLISPTGTGQREETAFLLGAADVVHKPYTDRSIRHRIQMLIDLHMHQWQLEKMVEDQSRTIRNTNQVMVDTLSALIEHRNTESGNHVLRIRRFTQLLLQEVARCCPEYELNNSIIDRISTASSLHDIGKISIPDIILNKPGKLTPEEFEIMKTHTTMGGRLAEQIGDIGDPMYLRYIYNICLYHHERWDGRGYPTGLKGDEIPICAQVVGLVDAYDALTTPRVYKPAFPYPKAVNMILNGECGAFSPKLLECFKRVRRDFEALALQYADGYSPKSDQIRIPLPNPDHKVHKLNALELSQIKYQTVLHHMNDTVIELDIDNRNYHVVYNPDPDFVTLFHNASFEEMSERLMADGAHPDDTESMQQMRMQLRQKLFAQNLRKVTFRCRIFSHLYEEHYPYEITLLRVNTDVPEQRIVLAIFHSLETDSRSGSLAPKSPPDPSMLYGLSASSLCCHTDPKMTIERGAGSLFALTGYSATEIRELFGNALLNMVHPEDQQALCNSRQLSGQWEGTYRILCKNSDPIWVLGKSHWTIDPEGQDMCYHLLIDFTTFKEHENWLTSRFQLHQNLVELSEGIILEWNIASQELNCSDRWEQRFGYPLRHDTLNGPLGSLAHVHPDDIPQLRESMERMLHKKQTEVVDVRIANSNGRYLWSRIRARVNSDSNGDPISVNAIIYDIDELKSDALALKKQAERDGLTKLLNKASAQQAIVDYLDSRDHDAMAALLILDLDNFKTVNDSLGHLYGDAVLTQIGETLRNLFRSHDIVGRIGGDEFVILLKNIPGRDIVLERCQLLVNTFRELLHRLMPKLTVSVSIGAALAPTHGTNYTDLFRHADEALYTAKRNGKCQFHLYDSQDAYTALSESALAMSRIDSDEQPAQNDDSMIRFVFRRLYESRDIDATINELLSFIGTHFNVSRVYIFENNEDNTTCSNTFEWCNEGIEPQLDFLQDLSYEEDLPGWKEVYEPTGVLYCSDVSELAPHIRAIVEPQGIKSMLHCAIMDRGVFRGYVGFDECTANYLWTQGQISMLQFMAEVLAVFLIKQRSADGNKKN